jgi:hypothetical protein
MKDCLDMASLHFFQRGQLNRRFSDTIFVRNAQKQPCATLEGRKAQPPGEDFRNPKWRNASICKGIENEYFGLKLGWTKEASVDTWGRLGLDNPGLVYLNMKHRRSGDRKALVQQKYETHAAPDQAQLYSAFLIYGAVQLRPILSGVHRAARKRVRT